MADELGTAVLRIEIDDGEARDQLRALRKEIEQAGRAVGRGTRSRRGGADPEEGGIDRQTVRRFNLRGFNAALKSIAEDIDGIRLARGLNINSSWTKALGQLRELDTDLKGIALGRDLNVRASWQKALRELSETAEVIRRTSADTRSRISAGEIAEGRRIGRLNVSPVRGGRAFPGSPGFFDSIFPAFPTQAVNRQARAQQLRQQRQQNIASNALIGGAFPLLFGQGVGAALGGAGGGAAGGAIGGQFGFGLSLLGTAVGAQFDAIIEKALTLGKALDDPIASFGALQESALLSSKGLERQIQGLIAVGREAEAAALIQQDLANSYGGLEAAKRLADEQDRLARTWAQFSVALGQVALTPIADSAQDAADALGGLSRVLQSISQGAPPAILRIAAGGVRAASSAITPVSSLVTGVADFVRSRRGAPQTESTAAPPEVTAGEEQRKQLLSQQFRLITAQVQGYQDLVLERQREIIETEKQIALDKIKAKGPEADPEREKITTDAKTKQFEIDEKILLLGKQRTADVEKRTRQEQAALLISTTSSALQSQAIERQIAAVRELGSVEVGAARDALNLRQQVTEQIATAQATVTRLGSEISAARLGGDEPRARALVLEQQNAAKEVQLAIERGALALRDAGKQLLEDAKSTARSLQGLREDNLQFQTPQEQARTLAELRRQVQAEATRRGVNVSFQGTPEEQRRQMRGFVSFGEEERRLVQQGEQISLALRTATQPLLDSNTTLGGNLTELSGAVSSLVQKDWNIVVNVQGGSGFDVEGASRGLS